MVAYTYIFAAVAALAIQASVAAPPQHKNNNANNSALEIHNKYRKLHHAKPLKWNTTLAKYAQTWSNGCDFKHSGGPYGENLAMGYSSWSTAIAGWYNEEKYYDFSKPGFNVKTGHFTQLVWKATTQLGCGVKKCPKGPIYTCSYSPPGNVVTKDNSYFKANVSP